MFSKRSRYFEVEQVAVTNGRGEVVTAVKLRPPVSPAARPARVTQGDRLDVICDRRYGDGTRYWHVADANSELEAAALTAEPARTIQVPER